jgi:hypothetical protein
MSGKLFETSPYDLAIGFLQRKPMDLRENDRVFSVLWDEGVSVVAKPPPTPTLKLNYLSFRVHSFPCG